MCEEKKKKKHFLIAYTKPPNKLFLLVLTYKATQIKQAT